MSASDAGSEEPGESKDPELDEDDPDYIAAHPPEEAVDPIKHFSSGRHKGKWTEFDKRGVPTRDSQQKKILKKDRDNLESEYLDVKKKQQQQLKAFEAWEDAQVQAEKALAKKDRLRWAFRHVGEGLHEPLSVNNFDKFVAKIGWEPMNGKDLAAAKKAAAEFADDENNMTLESVRRCVNEVLAQRLLEVRVGQTVGGLAPEDVYSPRTWRRKLEENPPEARLRTKSHDRKSRRTMTE